MSISHFPKLSSSDNEKLQVMFDELESIYIDSQTYGIKSIPRNYKCSTCPKSCENTHLLYIRRYILDRYNKPFAPYLCDLRCANCLENQAVYENSQYNYINICQIKVGGEWYVPVIPYDNSYDILMIFPPGQGEKMGYRWLFAESNEEPCKSAISINVSDDRSIKKILDDDALVKCLWCSYISCSFDMTKHFESCERKEMSFRSVYQRIIHQGIKILEQKDILKIRDNGFNE